MANIRPLDINVQPDALPTPYRNVPYSPEGFGDQTGDVLQRGAHVIGAIARDAQEKADASAVIGAIGQAKDALNRIILDPTSGYRSLNGADALAGRDKYLSDFDKAVSDTEGRLTNDLQRRAFQQHANVIREEGVRSAFTHEAQQQEHLAMSAFRGAADQTMRTLQGLISNPDQIQKQMEDLQTLSTAEALRQFGRGAPASSVQSIVGPEMQKGALLGMEAAVASQDPQVAQTALSRLGPYLGNHERFYTNVVQRMVATKTVSARATQLVGSALTPVVLPGGEQIGRLDAGKLQESLAKLDPADPFRDDIEKEVEKRQVAYERTWSHTVSQVVAGALTQGTDVATGQFAMSKVDPRSLQWLQQNAPDKLLALGKEDTRSQRRASGQDRRDSQYNRDALMWRMADPAQRQEVFGPMSAEQFQNLMLDEERYPGGFLPPERKAMIAEFKKIKAEAGKTAEKTTQMVRENLAQAFAKDPDKAKKYLPALVQDLDEFVAAEKARNNGKAPTEQQMRERIDYMIARPQAEHIWNFPDRRVDAIVDQRAKAARAGTSAASPVPTSGPSEQDKAALDWLQKNPTDAAAAGVRARLKKKGLL